MHKEIAKNKITKMMFNSAILKYKCKIKITWRLLKRR